MSRRLDRSARNFVITLFLLVAGLPAQAATVLDNFNADHDYQLGNTAGTVWNGMHNVPIVKGTGQFQAFGGTLRIDDLGANVGWDGGRSTAPFLYHTVPAGEDFTATVKVVSQTSGNWSTAGIIARAFTATPPGTGTDHAAQNFVTMTSFRTNDASVNEGTTLMKRIQSGSQVSDVNTSINGSTPINIAPLPLLLRIERVGGGTTYRDFVSDDGGATWQFQSRVRPDAGNPLRNPAIPMEVGLSYMNLGTLIGTAQLDDFAMETYAPKPAPGVPTLTTNIDITAHRGDIVTLSDIRDLGGLNTETMSWQLVAHPTNPLTPPASTTIRVAPTLLPLANGGETALADALGAPLPVDLAQDGSTLFRWNTNVAPNGMMTPQQWAAGTYKWAIRATNDWLQVSNDLLLTINLVVTPTTIPGDYNGDTIINTADYSVWRNRLGQTFDLPNKDPAATTPNVVDREDYNFWKSPYGQRRGQRFERYRARTDDPVAAARGIADDAEHSAVNRSLAACPASHLHYGHNLPYTRTLTSGCDLPVTSTSRWRSPQ
jgi:hypothetical protein